ncbi:hypothetical protein BDV93DRAFT_607872 [Ceratobasidium sp. AG-I]|nr:hypothetical protein BDV93DRAFT_607872 [Ceratobasidium sp. AG-I]
MDPPRDDGERRKPVSRPLSPALNSQGPPPPLPPANPQYPPPAAFDASFHTLFPATTFRPIRPFRNIIHPNSPTEDLSSLVYTLNADNMWEVNWALTRTLQSTAQSWSPPQFTTYVPADHPNPHQWMQSGGGYTHPPQPTQPPPPQPQMNQVAPGSREQFYRPPHNEPPSPNTPRHPPRTPISPPVPGPSNHRNSLASGSTSTAPVTAAKRGGRRRRGSTRSDTSDGKFRCEQCAKSYNRKAELDRHQRTNKKHNGIGKYPCGCCGRYFTRDDARLRHERQCELGEGSRRSSGSGSGKGKERDTDMDIDEDDEEES